MNVFAHTAIETHLTVGELFGAAVEKEEFLKVREKKTNSRMMIIIMMKKIIIINRVGQ